MNALLLIIHRLHRARAVSVGADRTARMWKVEEESQLLFRADASSSASHSPLLSLDCVAMLDDEHFITGGDDGSLSLWSSNKKRPLMTQRPHSAGHWLVSVAAAPYSDVLFSGSDDGFIHCYSWMAPPSNSTNRHSLSLSAEATTGWSKPRMELIHRIPCVGFVNSLNVAHSGRFLIAGVGQEHRAGRWTPTIKAAKNGLMVILSTQSPKSQLCSAD